MADRCPDSSPDALILKKSLGLMKARLISILYSIEALPNCFTLFVIVSMDGKVNTNYVLKY